MAIIASAEHSPPLNLDLVFGALADRTRRTILARLASGDATVNELTALSAYSQPTVSRHLQVLERAGLISRTREAQRRPCHLQAAPLAEASAWLEQYREFWEDQFSKLDALLAELQGEASSEGEAP